MPAEPPTKFPEAPVKSATKSAEQQLTEKSNPLRPEMPQIPGVGPDTHAPQTGYAGLDAQRLLQIGMIGAVALLVVGMIFWNTRGKPKPAAPSAEAQAPEPTTTGPDPVPLPALQTLEGAQSVAATVDQLSTPWSARKFTFVKPLTQEHIKAMVIRLPNEALWAFSLQAPFGQCELELVSDTAVLSSKYKFKATHPMVVNPCDGTVYDPLKVGPLGGNTWARGEIVQGNSLRPPISIDVKVQGRSVIADGIE